MACGCFGEREGSVALGLQLAQSRSCFCTLVPYGKCCLNTCSPRLGFPPSGVEVFGASGRISEIADRLEKRFTLLDPMWPIRHAFSETYS